MLNREKNNIEMYQIGKQIGWFGSVTSVSWPIRKKE